MKIKLVIRSILVIGYLVLIIVFVGYGIDAVIPNLILRTIVSSFMGIYFGYIFGTYIVDEIIEKHKNN